MDMPGKCVHTCFQVLVSWYGNVYFCVCVPAICNSTRVIGSFSYTLPDSVCRCLQVCGDSSHCNVHVCQLSLL